MSKTNELRQQTISDEVDYDEEFPSQMTASYSEILDSGPHSQVEPHSHMLKRVTKKPEGLLLNIEGHVYKEKDMSHYVADDLENKIKLSSPITRRDSSLYDDSSPCTSTPSGKQAPQIGQIDITVLDDLEYEVQYMAQSVDNLIERLSSILHSNSSLTARNMEVYKDAVGKTCDAMDNNIKSMYTMLAKGEELSQAMIPVQAQAARLTSIKNLLDLLDENL